MVPRYNHLMAASSVTEGEEDGNPEQNQSPPPYQAYQSTSPRGWLAEQPVAVQSLGSGQAEGPNEERLVFGEV